MIVEYIINAIIQFMSYLGYFGLFILMALESMIAPIPSEVVMPFAGFLIADNKFNWIMVFIFFISWFIVRFIVILLDWFVWWKKIYP